MERRKRGREEIRIRVEVSVIAADVGGGRKFCGIQRGEAVLRGREL